MKFRLYFKPFNDAGDYVADWLEVTDDVVTLGDMSWVSEQTDFDIGIFRTGGFNITMRNDQGKYGEASNQRSIFRVRRNETQVKITWDRRDYDLTCGFFQCGYEEITDEEIVFEGLLQDILSELRANEQNISFKVLGFESLFNNLQADISDITGGMLFSELFLRLLDDPKITNLLTLDEDNINVGIDKNSDDEEPLGLGSIKDALDQVLAASGSVIFISDRTIFVKDREATPDVRFTFYGQGSENGLENIIDITKYKDGLAKAFNFFEWADTDVVRGDINFVTENGFIKNTITSAIMQESGSTPDMEDILDYYVDSFKVPKPEMELETPIEYEQLYLRLYDKVIVDYPVVYTSADGNALPRYGQSFYGQARYPFGQYSLKISNSDRYKIMGRKINQLKGTITFSLRRI